MLSRGNVVALPGPRRDIAVPFQQAIPSTIPVRDQPHDFPPGSPGSALPYPVPPFICRTLAGIGKGHVIAWQPVLKRAVLWKPKPRRFVETEDMASIRAQLTLGGLMRWEIEQIIEPLVRSEQSGWQCCFVLQNGFGFRWANIEPGDPIPLDWRFLALLYDSDPDSYGGIRAMREHVKDQHNAGVREIEDRKRDRFNEAFKLAREHTKIRVGRGRSPGNRSLLQNRPDLAARDGDVPDL